MSVAEIKAAVLQLASYIQTVELEAQVIRDKLNDHQQLSLFVLVGTRNYNAQEMIAVVSQMIEVIEELLELINAYYTYNQAYLRELG